MERGIFNYREPQRKRSAQEDAWVRSQRALAGTGTPVPDKPAQLPLPPVTSDYEKHLRRKLSFILKRSIPSIGSRERTIDELADCILVSLREARTDPELPIEETTLKPEFFGFTQLKLPI